MSTFCGWTPYTSEANISSIKATILFEEAFPLSTRVRKKSIVDSCQSKTRVCQLIYCGNSYFIVLRCFFILISSRMVPE